jgi:membrane protein implicated in regulation of membrane protease activity
MAVDFFGVALVVIGLILFGLELVHPGALLFIPGSIILVAGILYIFFPSTLLSTPYGVITILVVAIVAALVQIPFYQWVAPNHRPMTSTSAGFTGQTAMVVSPIVPDSLSGKVRIGTEVWSARSDAPIPSGTRVRIISGEGVSVRVVPIDETAS